MKTQVEIFDLETGETVMTVSLAEFNQFGLTEEGFGARFADIPAKTFVVIRSGGRSRYGILGKMVKNCQFVSPTGEVTPIEGVAPVTTDEVTMGGRFGCE